MGPADLAAPLPGLAVALGAGLLIGLERERRKGEGPGRQAAGIRSFTLVALGGGLAQALGQPALVAVGALAVVLLAGLAYGFDRWRDAARPGVADPGMTTELALVVTWLVGVLAVQQPALGAGCAAVVAALLAARGGLHRFATRLLSEQELHDGLLLAALGLVLLPLVPQAPVPWLAGLQPSVLAGLVLLILLMQAAGHMATRWAGPGLGLPLSGLLGGFVSSTATVAAMGSRARSQPALAGPCTAAAVLSTAATWLQALLMLTALAPPLAADLAPALGAGAAAALALGGALAWRARQARPTAAGRLAAAASTAATDATTGAAADAATHRPATAAGRAASPAGPGATATAGAAPGGALQVRQALAVAALLTGVTLGVHQAGQWWGQAGALAAAVLAGLGDAHAGVAAMAALWAQGQLAAAAAGAGVLGAVAANAVTRVVVAASSGGGAFARWVGAGLLASVLAAGAVGALTGVLSAHPGLS